MNLTIKLPLVAAALALTLSFHQADAYVRSHLSVESIAATAGAQDLMLHRTNNGSTFLYVEEQQGAVLAVYDVTDPAHITLESSVPTGGHGSYDFVGAIGNRELIAFRDGSGSGVIDLQLATAPKLAMIAGAAPASSERLGDSGYLASSFVTAGSATRAAAQPRSVQVVETATEVPRVVSTVARVTKQVARPETGTTFLLGENGVTVIRQIATERAYEEQLALWKAAN
jgi:hypothetical protein